MPVFADGVVASASDLNRISETQQFLADAAATLNFGFEMIKDATENRSVFHRFRYLNWSVLAPVSGHFMINDHDVGAIAASATSGRIDLGHGYGYNGPNPYGLTLNRAYQVRFTSDVDCNILFEHYTTGQSISLPYGAPSFGGMLTASQLNAVAQDTKHILEYGYHVGVGGFVGRTYSLVDQGANRGFGRVRRWTFKRRGRYLHFRGSYNPNGTQGYHYGFEMYLNGTRFYVDGADYNQVSQYDFIYDMQSPGNSINYGVAVGSFQGTPATPAVGSTYYVEMVLDGNEPYNPNSSFTTQLLVEAGFNTRI
jgi:hypothetical protein